MSRNLSGALLNFQRKTGYKLGKNIYSADGIVALYRLVGHPDKVVKIASDIYGPATDTILDRLEYLKKANNPSVVKIYKYGKLTTSATGNTYYYIMQKLEKVPAQYASELASQIYRAVECGLKPRKQSKKLKMFLKNISKLKYQYLDVHSANIMQNSVGNYKFIDLESFAF